MATKVSSSLINTVSASQILTSGATAGQVLTYNGSTSTWIASAAPGSTGGGLGVGQTWQAVTRTAGTTYTNATGKPIMFCISGYSVGSGGSFSMSVGGVIVMYPGWGNGTTSGLMISVIVPDQTTYSFTNSGYTITAVTELR